MPTDDMEVARSRGPVAPATAGAVAAGRRRDGTLHKNRPLASLKGAALLRVAKQRCDERNKLMAIALDQRDP